METRERNHEEVCDMVNSNHKGDAIDLNCATSFSDGRDLTSLKVPGVAAAEERLNSKTLKNTMVDEQQDIDSPAGTAIITVAGDPSDLESTEEKVKGGGWSTIPFIIGCEAGERMAISGSHVNLISYFVNVMHHKTLQSATAINTFTSTSAWSPLLGAFFADAYLGPYSTILYGSAIYLGGLILITLSAAMSSLHPPPCLHMNREKDANSSCVPASPAQMGLLYISLSLMVLGSGGIRPCVSPFGASQFNRSCPKENSQLKSYFNFYYVAVTIAALIASTGIVYIQDNVSWGLGFGISAGVMLLSTVIFVGGSFLYRFSKPQGSAFTRMAQVLTAAIRKRHLVLPTNPSLLYHGPKVDHQEVIDSDSSSEEHLNDLGSKVGRDVADDYKPPVLRKDSKGELMFSGESLVEEAQNEELTLAAGEGRPRVLNHSRWLRFLDKAAMELESDHHPEYNHRGEIVSTGLDPWRLCPVQHVEELKSILRLFPMWTTGVVGGISTAQTLTYLVQQARTMDRNIGSLNVPPATIHVITTITIIVWLPIYDRLLVPKLIAPRTGNPKGFSLLQKIGIGYTLHILAQVFAIIFEHKRRMAAMQFGFLDKPNGGIPFSAFWLVPQLVTEGLAYSFSVVGHMEFFYHMVPEHLTSTASALGQTPQAAGTLLASGLINFVQKETNHGPDHPGWLDENLNRAHLDYYYVILLLLSFTNLLFYLFIVTKWYKKHLNMDHC